ncbi:MAG: HAD-IIIA family hydrolase [Daejeonella sp.]
MFLEKLKFVKAFVFDVDGVLTDGTVLVTESGEQLRQFNIKDGYALQLAVKRGYPIAIISGGRSKGIKSRLLGLGIKNIFLGVEFKTQIFSDFLKDNSLSADEVLYMGDDIPDVLPMKLSGLPVCPADAVNEVKEISVYISGKDGGKGCVRDVIEKVLKIQGQWNDEKPSASDGSILA